MLDRILCVLVLICLSVACSDSEEDLEGQQATNSGKIPTDSYVVYESAKTSQYKTSNSAGFVFKSSEEWKSHYSLIRGNEFDRENAPILDGSEIFIAVHLGETIGESYAAEVVDISFDTTDNVMHIRWRSVFDTTKTSTSDITYPYVIARANRSSLEYRFIRMDERVK